MPDTFRERQHGRVPLHMHSKHAATLDGHRPDDPNAVTGPWRGGEGEGGEEITARPVGWTGNTRRQPQTVPYDDEVDYGQRVEALDDLAERVDWEEEGWEPGEEGPLEQESDEYSKLGMEGQPTAKEPQASPWQTDDPNRLSIPASKVLGHIDHKQLMIDASSTGGGQTDSHLIPFYSTPDNIGMLKKGKWRAEGQRKTSGDIHWQMHPDNAEETK